MFKSEEGYGKLKPYALIQRQYTNEHLTLTFIALAIETYQIKHNGLCSVRHFSASFLQTEETNTF